MAEIAVPSNARSRRTRAALLDAARSILETDGFEALTMGAVATTAGVSRGAAYLHFGSRADLVAALFDHIAGQQRLDESMAEVWAAPDAATALERWAAHLARYHPPLMTIDRAVQRVADHDTEAGAHRDRVMTAQLESCRRLAGALHDEGRLADGWNVDTAADVLYGLIASDLIDRLLNHRAWSARELEERLAMLFRNALVDRP